MEPDKQIDFLKSQLDRILGFFSRVETKASVILSVDMAMLALVATNTPPIRAIQLYMIMFAIPPISFLIASLWHLYLVSFPRLDGGQQSLIYFREIANRTEANFIEEFLKQDGEALKKDLLGQIWRNAEILKQKFDHLKKAYQFMAISIPFWLFALAVFAAKNTELKGLLAK